MVHHRSKSRPTGRTLEAYIYETNSQNWETKGVRSKGPKGKNLGCPCKDQREKVQDFRGKKSIRRTGGVCGKLLGTGFKSQQGEGAPGGKAGSQDHQLLWQQGESLNAGSLLRGWATAEERKQAAAIA